jgi:hypothetical protein
MVQFSIVLHLQDSWSAIAKMNLLKNNTNPKDVLTQQESTEPLGEF